MKRNCCCLAHLGNVDIKGETKTDRILQLENESVATDHDSLICVVSAAVDVISSIFSVPL